MITKPPRNRGDTAIKLYSFYVMIYIVAIYFPISDPEGVEKGSGLPL